MSTSYRMPLRLVVEWRMAETEAVPAARISLRTRIVFAPVEVQLFLRTRRTMPESEAQDMIWRVNLFPPGVATLHDIRRVIGSLARKRLAMRVTDANGHPLSEEFAVGPGAGERRHAELAFLAPVELSAWVAPCDGPGPGHGRLSLRGEATFSEGVALEWIARSATDARVDRASAPPRIALAAPGRLVQVRERALEQESPSEGWVSAGFVDERGHELSDRCLLGRYVLP